MRFGCAVAKRKTRGLCRRKKRRTIVLKVSIHQKKDNKHTQKHVKVLWKIRIVSHTLVCLTQTKQTC